MSCVGLRAAAAGLLGEGTNNRRGGERSADSNYHCADASLGGLHAIGASRGDGDGLGLGRAPAPAGTPAHKAIEAAEAVPAAVGPDEPGRPVERTSRDRDDAAGPCLRPAVRGRPIGPVLGVIGAVGAAPLAGALDSRSISAELASPAAGRGPRHRTAGVGDRLHACAAGAGAR